MRVERLWLGFSVADTTYPDLAFTPGRLTCSFHSSSGEPIAVAFDGVPAFSWQESDGGRLADEPWDQACEVFDSPLLAAHPPGSTMYAVAGLRHVRLHCNAWGRLDVLCTGWSRKP